MASHRTASFSDTTEAQATTAGSVLTSVYVQVDPAGTAADVFVQLWDGTAVTPGVTTPDSVLFIPAVSITGGKYSYRWVFPATHYATGLEYFPSTTATGATASTIVLAVEVNFLPYTA